VSMPTRDAVSAGGAVAGRFAGRLLHQPTARSVHQGDQRRPWGWLGGPLSGRAVGFLTRVGSDGAPSALTAGTPGSPPTRRERGSGIGLFQRRLQTGEDDVEPALECIVGVVVDKVGGERTDAGEFRLW